MGCTPGWRAHDHLKSEMEIDDFTQTARDQSSHLADGGDLGNRAHRVVGDR